MALNKISDGRQHKFYSDNVIGDIVLHDRPPHAGQLMFDAARNLAKEQMALRVPRKYQRQVIYGRVEANPLSTTTVEQLGYDYWFYLPSWTQQGGKK